MVDSKGYVLVKGEKGKEVPNGTSVFSAVSCITEIDYVGQRPEEDKPTENTGITTTPIKKEEPEIAKKREGKIAKINETLEKLNAIQMEQVTAANVVDWFNRVEEYVDSLPTMEADGTIVYHVEKSGDKWIYTGESEEMDPLWNESVQWLKSKFCAVLNGISAKATSLIQTMLQAIVNKVSSWSPVMNIMVSLFKVPSLTSIINWAKGVIDMIKNLYQMILTVYKTVMTLLEIIVIRFPQLISKIMDKITEWDCPIAVKITSVKVKKPEKK